MEFRRSLSLPITIAVIMIVLLVALIVGWILITASAAQSDDQKATLYWTFLPIGATFLAMILAGVVFYMILSIKAINLSQRQANFIDSVTHELKSPIASLKLYLQTLNRLNVSPEKAVDFYSTMLEDVERLDNLINHLLDAGRLDRDREDPEIVDIRLDHVLAATAASVTMLYRVPQESIELDLQPCILRGARGDLDIIFRNLMDNAIKYSGNDVKVQVRSKIKADGTITVEVADNGPGIPKSKRVIIFSRFSRLGVELQREKPGTGLGLYIVRTLVRRVRGTVQVRDVQSDSGTVFVVTLPGGHRIPPDEAASSGISSKTGAHG